MSKQNVRLPFEGTRSRVVNLKNRRFFSVVLMATLFLFLTVTAAVGQTTVNGTISGVVKDPQGRVVPDATVTLTSVDRPDERQVKTSEDGAYVLTSVVPGKYSIKVEAAGFKTAAQTGPSIAASENV